MDLRQARFESVGIVIHQIPDIFIIDLVMIPLGHARIVFVPPVEHRICKLIFVIKSHGISVTDIVRIHRRQIVVLLRTKTHQILHGVGADRSDLAPRASSGQVNRSF